LLVKDARSSPGRVGSLQRRFVVFYFGFALLPFGLLFYLFTQYGVGSQTIGVTRNNLGVLILLVGACSLIGFLAMQHALRNLVLLSESMRKASRGSAQKEYLGKLIEGEGEVTELTELANSFNTIITQLEDNISELESTKNTLHRVLEKVGRALTSMDDFSSLVQVVLETTLDALDARDGAVLTRDNDGRYHVEAKVLSVEIRDEELLRLLGPHLTGAEKTTVSLGLGTDGTGDAGPLAGSAVLAPLGSHGQDWGALYVGGGGRHSEFSEDELKIINNLSYQLAISFENMNLNADNERAYFETISALALAVEARDPYSRGHSERVAKLCVKMGRSIGLPQEDLDVLRDAARLHDIGKIGISDNVLRKAGPLNDDEIELMKRHTIIGETIVKPLKSFSLLLDPIRHHHERLDGSGYPDRLAGDQISLITRVLMVADVYDAVTSERPYRGPMGWDDTKRLFRKRVELSQMDGSIVEHFIQLLETGEKSAMLEVEADA